MRAWLARFRDGMRRDRLDAELAEELRFQREQIEKAARREGADDAGAQDAASLALGNETLARESNGEFVVVSAGFTCSQAFSTANLRDVVVGTTVWVGRC